MDKADILVIGAGPSGLRLASRLAGSGLDVIVLERKPRVGADVVCTGIVNRGAFDEFGLDRASVLSEIRRVRLVSPSGSELEYEHPRSFACVVDREKFDGTLADEARSVGASILCGARAESLSVERGGVEVAVRSEDGSPRKLRASLAVLATGVDFALHERAGLSRPRDLLLGAQVEASCPKQGPTTLFVGRGVAPGAFAWSVPTGAGTTRIGLLAERAPREKLRRLLEERFGASCGTGSISPVRMRPVAQGLVSGTFGERVLAVGEAAGQTKTTTGGGISYGLTGADLAAEVVRSAFARSAFSAADLAVYERRWKDRLQREIVVGHIARRVCARLTDRQMETLFDLARTDGILPLVREHADFDRHSRLLLALARRLSFMAVFREVLDSLGSQEPS